jgi:hypothetical protein
MSRRQFFQLVINQRHDDVESLPIAGMNTLKQFRNLHGRLPEYCTANASIEG